MEYFVTSIFAVSSRGEIVSVDGNGLKTKRWDSAIAAALPFPAAGWKSAVGSTTTVDFVPFKGKMLIHNGVDKPLSVAPNLAVSYLGDAASNYSNVFVPIGRFGCVVSDYHCVAGIPATPTSIYVSSKGTDGTFIGAPPPNDGIVIDVGAYAPDGAPEIRGIAGFRSYLIVFFATQSLLIKLGNYEGEGANRIHVPQFPDTMPQFGLLSHRCYAVVENDLIFAGRDGVSSARRNLQSAEIDSTFISNRVEPTYRHDIGMIDDNQLRLHAFMVKDKLEHTTVTFLPSGKAFAYSSDESPKYQSWSIWEGPEWTCGCTSFLGRVFYAQGNRIYMKGNSIYDNEKIHADKQHDRDLLWTVNTFYSGGQRVHDQNTNRTFTCLLGHTSGLTTIYDDIESSLANPVWEEYLGLPIEFELETPWMDSHNPMQVKQTRFISINSKGTARFTVAAHVENLYEDIHGNQVYEPAIRMDFLGNEAVGFGQASIPYGGSRRSNDPRLYKYPVRFKQLKLRIYGSTIEPLEIGTVSLLFSSGKYKY